MCLSKDLGDFGRGRNARLGGGGIRCSRTGTGRSSLLLFLARRVPLDPVSRLLLVACSVVAVLIGDLGLDGVIGIRFYSMSIWLKIKRRGFMEVRE